MPSPELKPCPFCGGAPEIVRDFVRLEYVVTVNCTDCPAHVRVTGDIGHDFDRLEAEVVAAWNRRAGEEKE